MYVCMYVYAYASLVELMASGLVEVRSKRKKSQAWFSKQLAELRKSVHKSESAWLRSRSREDKREKSQGHNRGEGDGKKL